MTRAIEPDDADRAALEELLAKIEAAGMAIAAEYVADIRVEKERGGRFPYVTFRAYGFREDESDLKEAA